MGFAELTALLALISKLGIVYMDGKKIAEQNAALTEQERQELTAKEEEAFKSPAWQPDPPHLLDL